MKAIVKYCITKQSGESTAVIKQYYHNIIFFAKDEADICRQVQEQHIGWEIEYIYWEETTNQGGRKMSWKLPSTKKLEEIESSIKRNEQLQTQFNERKLGEAEKKINEIFMRLQSIEEYISVSHQRFGDLIKYLDIERASTPAQMFYRKKGKKTK